MTAPRSRTTLHIHPDRSVGVFNIIEVWKFRGLLGQMINRNLRVRVLNSPTSLIWNFVRPGIMTLVFVFLRQSSSADFGTDVPYALHVFAGLCFWFLFSEATLQVAGSVAADAGVSQKVYFPRVLSPITALASRWIDLVVISLAIAALQLSFGIGTDSELAVYPAALLGLLLLAFGLGVLFAGLMIVHPDHRRILETILYLGLFLSPVLFSSAILPEAARPFAAVNPMTGILSALRGALFEPEQIDYFAWTIASLASLALALVGLWVLAVSARNHAEKL